MPPTPEPPTHISIKVKVPPGYLSTADDSSGTDSFLLGSQIPITANVGNLRTQIQSLIPTHPPPERQRLLYGGRALVDNEQRLGDAFNVRRDPTQTDYVVHLLVKGEQGASEGGPAHRRTVSTPPAHMPGGQQAQQGQIPFQHAMNGQRQHLPQVGPQIHPGQPPFPQIIARNQQMRAGMGMQGIGQQAQGQPHDGGQAGANAAAGQTGQHAQQSGHDGGLGQNGQRPQQGQQQHIPGRPISGQGVHMQGVGPNGQRFHIHQQMMQFPGGQMPFGFPGMPQVPGMMPGMANHGQGPAVQQQNHGPSALDRARENMAEVRRLVDEMRNENSASEQLQRRIEDIQRRTQSLNEYIDPLNLGNATNGSNGQRAAPTNPGVRGNRTALPQPFHGGLPPLYNAPRRPTVPLPTAQHVRPPSNPNDVTAYLLSGPQGPQALLFSPQHGAYTGVLANNARPQPTPTTAAYSNVATQQNPQQPQPHQPQPHDHQQQQQQDPVAAAAARAAAELQLRQQNAGGGAVPGQQDPMQALLGHFWLLMRIMIFAWFLLGSNMGWQRPLLLLAIGAGFWAVRAGVLGDGAAVRRWWEGVVGVEQPMREGQGQGQEGRQQQPGEGQQGDGQAQGQGANRNAMPTPEQVAHRLLNEQRERNAQQNAWWRERIRPVERAVALFVASLWPGVGEATVRARREMDERLRREEEEREVEANRRRVEEAGEGEQGSEGGEAKDGGSAGVGTGGGSGSQGTEKGGASGVPTATATGREEAGGEGLRERRMGGEGVQVGGSGNGSAGGGHASS